MTFAIRVLRTLFPKQETQRMELRRVILEAEASAEDLQHTLKVHHKLMQTITKANGKAKDM